MKWLLVPTTGATCRTSVEPSPAPPPRVESTAYQLVTPPALVVAPLADVAILESCEWNTPPFHWSDIPINLTHLALLRCLDDGEDSNAPLEPIEEARNPFTGEVLRRTMLDRAQSFEVLFEGKLVSAEEAGALAEEGYSFDQLVMRIPQPSVARWAAIPAAGIVEIAQRWARAWSTLDERQRRGTPPFTETNARYCLELLVASAKVAMSREHELFLWGAA